MLDFFIFILLGGALLSFIAYNRSAAFKEWADSLFDKVK